MGDSFSFGLDLGGINRGFRWMGELIVLGWAYMGWGNDGEGV